MIRKGPKTLLFYCITFTVICQAIALCGGLFAKPVAAAKDVENFYFKKYTVDFYLSKAEDDTSVLKVREEFTAAFPTYNQNKGICRNIPYSTKNGTNITIKTLTKSDVKLFRNGAVEPIYSIDRENGYFRVCTGTEEYVTGDQVYTFEYTFKNVINHFEDGSKSWDELYWNTNGTDWKQRFENVTARLHFEDPSIWTGEKWCYVGKQGAKNQTRCSVRAIEDGVEFHTDKLAAYENLTFDVELLPDSFVVIEPEKSYVMLFVLAGVVAFVGFIAWRIIKKYYSVSEKREFYKGRFIAPQYEPAKDHGLLEMAANYIGTIKDSNTALLLQMIVDGRIDLVKGEKRLFGGYYWKINVKNLANILPEERTLLKILNGAKEVKTGDIIELKRYTATSSLVSLGRSLRSTGPANARANGLFEKNSFHNYKSAVTVIFVEIAIFMMAPFVLMACMEYLPSFVGGETVVAVSPSSGKILVGFVEVILLSGALLIATFIARCIVATKVAKYEKRTKLGLEMSRYMDGLKLYIKMAEADRLKFLQSVKTADTSPEGIVKLYEKLLPYAALFGLEKSWMEELKHYSEVHEIDTPTWYTHNIGTIAAISSFTNTLHDISTISTSSSSYSSSGSSGSGGGGSSGGGGGGGGGGGR